MNKIGIYNKILNSTFPKNFHFFKKINQFKAQCHRFSLAIKLANMKQC